MVVDSPTGTKLQGGLEPQPDPALFRIRDLIYQNAGIFHPTTNCVCWLTAAKSACGSWGWSRRAITCTR